MRDHWTSEDRARLRPHNARVLYLMLDMHWWTLGELADTIPMRSASSVASRLRDIKAETNYSYERRRSNKPGVFEYRLIVPDPNPTQLELTPIEDNDGYRDPLND